MSRFFKKALIAAATVSATLAFAPAQADVMSSAVVRMSDFKILGSNGVQLDASNFSFLTFTTSADQAVALTGFASQGDTAGGVAPINFAPRCLGVAGFCGPFIAADNAFPKLFAPPFPGNYSAADQNEAGSPITGLSGFVGNAIVENGSFAGLTAGTVGASADSNNNLNSSFIFSLNQPTGITFDFLVNAFLQAAITNDEIIPGFATASYQMDFTITNLGTGATVWTFAPDLFGDGVKTLSLNAPLPIDIENFRDTGGNVAFSSTTPTLASGTLYQLSARIQTNADALRLQAVPEPAMLGLVGLGLLAAGLGARRRKLA